MDRRGSATLILVVAASLSLTCGDCGCGRVDVVAEVERRDGAVDRDHTPQIDVWQSAKVGDQFVMGEGIRTGKDSTAVVRFTVGGGLFLKSETLVRFLSSAAQPGTGVDVQAGEAEVDGVSGRGVFLSSKVGRAVIEPGARVRMKREGDRLRLHVLVGRATLEKNSGGSETVEAGERLIIDIQQAIVERVGRAPPDAGVAPPPKPEPKSEGVIKLAVRGRTVRIRKEGGSEWNPIASGTSTATDRAEIRLPRNASVEVTRGAEKALVTGPAEVVVGAEEGALIQNRKGRATTFGDDAEVVARVPGGVIVAKAGSRAQIDVDSRGRAKISAPKGRVEIRTGSRTETIVFGEAATVLKNGRLDFSMRMPTRADFAMKAGESPTVHDPKGKSAIRIGFKSVCPGEGAVELVPRGRSFKRARIRAVGTGSAIVPAKRGTFKYRVRCNDQKTGDGIAARGRIRVLADSGRVRVPASSAQNTLEADGRRYTVLYQNLLPRLTFKWADAPTKMAASYVLRIKSSRHTRTAKATEPIKVFRAGDIPEGTYKWWFEADTEGVRSPETTLVLDFDNAAPAAYVRSPPLDAKVSGSTIKVAGAAMLGAVVSVDDTPVELDKHRRFDAEVPLPKDEDGIAIRIQHPRHGVHYYVRKPRRE